MKKFLIITFVLAAMILLTPMLSTASAAQSGRATANGVGIFEHDHDGIPHTHYFVFGVSTGSLQDSPQGKFNLVCKHDGQIATIIFSTDIDSFGVEAVQGGLKAVFSGSALVKMGVADWEKGWTFVVTAFDYGKGSDLIGVTLITPLGEEHCAVEPTPLASGNIGIRAIT